jgi:hypothetical protein
MNPIKIRYIFSAGFRCYSPDTLKRFGLRPFSGPFDYLFIDLESVFKLVNLKMSLFLSNILVFNKNKQHTYDLNSLNNLNTKHVCYMAHDYNSLDLLINTNFIDDNLSGNLYEWNSICIFHHHNILNREIYDTIAKRVDRFNNIMEQHYETTCLFHITKILSIYDIQEYMNNIILLKVMYYINSYIIIIVCCDNLEDSYYFKEKVLFIFKKVAPYSTQIELYKTDNNLDYTMEINIMKNFFNFQLVPISEV